MITNEVPVSMLTVIIWKPSSVLLSDVMLFQTPMSTCLFSCSRIRSFFFTFFFLLYFFRYYVWLIHWRGFLLNYFWCRKIGAYFKADGDEFELLSIRVKENFGFAINETHSYLIYSVPKSNFYNFSRNKIWACRICDNQTFELSAYFCHRWCWECVISLTRSFSDKNSTNEK